MLGEEAQGARAHDDAAVADGRHDGDGRVERDFILAGGQRVEDGDDIRQADADHEEEGERGHERRHDVDGDEADGADETAEKKNAFFAESGDDAVADETADEHRGGINGETDARRRQVEMFRFRQEDAAPVHDGAFGQEGNKREAAQDGDEAARPCERFLPAVTAKRNEFPVEIQAKRQEKRDVDGNDGKDGEAAFRQNGVKAGADEAADAPKAVHAGENAARGDALDDDGMEIHRDVQRSHPGAENEEDDEVRPKRGEDGDDEDGDRHDECRRHDDAPASEMPRKNSGDGHEKKGGQPDGQEQQPQNVRADGESFLDEGNHRRPCGDEKAAREKGALGRMNFTCTGGKIF